MKNRKRFTVLAVAAALTFSMVSGTGSMVMAEDDASMEAVESDTFAEESVSDTDVSANDDNSAATDESLSDSSEEITESIENTIDDSSEAYTTLENSSEVTTENAEDSTSADSEISLYSTMLTSEETDGNIYTLSLDDSWEYTSNPSVGEENIAYLVYGTCNGENITDFSDYTLTAVVDDETIAEAEIKAGYMIGIDGISYSLNVTGLAVGSTTVTALLQDENGNVLAASETVPITVNEAYNERTYYTIEIDEDSIYPGQSLLVNLTRVEVTSTKVISTDVSDKITSVEIGTQYAYDENNNYVTSGLFSVSGSTADGWYLNVLDYGTVQLLVYYSDGETTSYESTYLQTWSGSGGTRVTPEQSEYTVKVGASITIEFDTIYTSIAKDGYERSNSYKNAYTVDATETYNGSAAYEYCSIECSGKNVTITGLKEGSADITIAMYTPGYVGDDKVSDKQLTIHVVSADSSTETEATEPETTEPETTEPETTETETTETASTETDTTVAGITETGTAETSATEAASTESTTESESETEDSSVETGDNSPVEFYIAVMLLAMAIMVTGTFERRMRRN